jgi:predicted MFS family arabinose efflux permease
MIKWLEGTKYSQIFLTMVGVFLVALSFAVLLVSPSSWVLIAGIILMTFGEMLAFPYSNAFVIERAKRGNIGEYMGYYTVSFSIAHIFGHNSGMQLIDRIGFDQTWMIITIFTIVGVLFLALLMRMLKKESAV